MRGYVDIHISVQTKINQFKNIVMYACMMNGDRGALGIRGIPDVSLFFLCGCIHIHICSYTHICTLMYRFNCIDLFMHGYMVEGDRGAQNICSVPGVILFFVCGYIHVYTSINV